jgi:riboflavin kinase/FMN adenylyltransferase
MPFTQELSHVSAEHFLDRLKAEIPTLAAIVVGANWRFGHQARGDAKLLADWGRRAGVDAIVLDRLLWHGKPISSTRIREAVQAGHLDQAEAMLGRPFSIFGPVVHGDQIGRKLGFPTANVEPFNEVRPPPGIYAVRTRLDGRALGGAAYVPDRPGTDKANRGIVEVHLLDFNEDIYGVDLEVHFAAKLRDDIHFANLDDLKAQIGRDVQQVRALLQHA